jgi:hypothetical protein
MAQHLIFCPHDFGNVRLGDNSVIVDGDSSETPGISCSQPRQVAHEQVEGFVCGLHVAPTVFRAPLSCRIQNDGAKLFRVWQGQSEARSVGLEFFRHLKRMTDQHNRGVMLRVIERDVFQLPNVEHVLHERMEIEQHEKAIVRGALDVGQQFVRLVNGLQWLIHGIESLHPVGYSPTICLELKALANLPDNADDLRFFIAFHGDQRRA